MNPADAELDDFERWAVAEEKLSVLRHDLRNRLGAIRSAGFYLGKRAETTTLWAQDKRVPQFFELIEAQVSEAERMLSDQATFSSHALRPLAAAELAPAVRRALSGLEVPASVTVRLALAPSPLVELCEAEVALLVRCLVKNSLEAMPSGGTLDISTSGKGRDAVLSVTDSGPGMSDAQISSALVAFQSTKANHQGVGLNIARRICARYRGQLSFERPAAGGFTVRAVLAFIAEERPSAPRPAVAARGRGTLLLVDDDMGNLLTLAALLEDEGFSVHTAGSLAGARAALATFDQWTAVLLDQRLPDGEGVSLVPELRRTMPRTRVLLLTGAPEDIGQSSGADAVLEKGLPLPRLIEQLRG